MPRPYWDTCVLAACYVQLGREGEARDCVAQALGEMADLSLQMFAKRAPNMEQTELDGLLDDLRRAGLPAGPNPR